MTSQVKFDQRIYQENLILKKVLSVTLIHPTDTNDPLASLGSNLPVTYLPGANAELMKYPGIKSLLEKRTLFDTIFSDVLAQPNKYGYMYLMECYQTYSQEKEKAVNKDSQLQELFQFIKEIIVNYASILALNPDIFPNCLPYDEKYDGIEVSAYRLVHLLEQSGYSGNFMAEFNNQLRTMDEDAFKQIYEFIFTTIRKRFQTDITIFDSSSTSLLDVLSSILGENDEFKELFIKCRHQGIAWIPGPNGINLEKGIGSCTGDLLEHQSVLGPFFSISFLPTSLTLKGDDRFQKVVEKVEDELKQAKSQSAYNKIASNLQELQHKYVLSLNNLIKTLLKGKNVREQVMRFLAACVVSNTPRAKLGHSLAQNAMQNKLNIISSDSFCLNAMYVMHELCLPFLNLNDAKEMWKKIDPSYIPSGLRMDLTDETPINISKEFKKGIQFPKEYGTITEFYFMELEMIHFGLMHTIRKYLDIRKLIERLQEEKKQTQGNQQMQDKYDNELKILKPFRIAYEMILTDNNLDKAIERFYTVHMRLMQNWGEFNQKLFKFGKSPNLFCYLPENFFIDFFDVFTELIKVNPKGHKMLMNETILTIVEFCLALVRTEQEAITNPYMKAKAIELITIFIYSDEKKELGGEFSKSELIKSYLMETLIQFYVDIEFAGQNMFYSKFQYRHDCSVMFQRFWLNESFRQKIRDMVNTKFFEKFLNALINDMQFCLEEGLSKIKKIKEFEEKQDRDPRHLTKEDLDNNDQDRKICRANFQLAQESLWNVKQLSAWCKKIFEEEAFSDRIAMTLNYVLAFLVGPECQYTLVKNPEKLGFKPNDLLQDLVAIYTNLYTLEGFCKSVIKDDRSFKPEYLNQALRRLKVNKTVEYVQELENFIKIIPKYTQQEAELDEILGNEAPEEFICPLSGTLMKEPMLLPTSGNVCEFSIMKRILLDKELDPFNRAPLKLDDLQPEKVLKARIERWIQQKLAGEETDEDKRKKEQEGAAADLKKEESKMQIDEGDYSSCFFDDDQLKELKGGQSQEDVDMFSQQTISNFMAKDRFGNNFDRQ